VPCLFLSIAWPMLYEVAVLFRNQVKDLHDDTNLDWYPSTVGTVTRLWTACSIRFEAKPAPADGVSGLLFLQTGVPLVHLVPKLLPLPNTPSWLGAYLSAGTILSFYFVLFVLRRWQYCKEHHKITFFCYQQEMALCHEAAFWLCVPCMSQSCCRNSGECE
jgi:hypothetical protein